MRQASQVKPYSKQLSDHYLNKRKLKNKRVREEALKALQNDHRLTKKNLEKAGT
ncbi:hypothetical protein RYX56_17150 [Alkalihalophilus lindianensis]|uniref:Uncharacterized protein n=1 Tax=Alkalihalophilus lindianensis TaxID=1630542 RepID=A0ABU3XE39_9BACI|nr:MULTISPECIES: hypothetical protein [Bacillaceae]MDV2686098.1 hypothetical protein [Alkalihalophilus lindianensis]